MRHNVKQEFSHSMDSLRFSVSQKEAMTQMLMNEMNKQNKYQRKSGRKLLLLSLAAAILLMTLTGAAVFTRWSQNTQHRYHPTQEIKDQAEKTGLSVMLEGPGTETKPNEILTATDQGITITAVQTLIDDYSGEITFRIEGFDLPEGRFPYAWPTITIDGETPFSVMSGGFFDGTTHNEAGQWVYADTGLPVESNDDEFQSAILKPVAKDGSLEFTSTFSFHDDFGSVGGKEIVVSFDGIGVAGEKKAEPSTYLVEGSWELRWTLSSASETLSFTPNASVGNNGATLLTADIGQKTIVATYQLQEYWDGWEVLDSLREGIKGVHMKDGSEYFCYPSTEGYKAKDTGEFVSPLRDGYEDMDTVVYYMEFSMVDALLDPSQVESLLFHKGWERDENGEPTKQIFDYVPLS